MPSAPREAVRTALAGFVGDSSLRACATALLGALGYHSDRTMEFASVSEFVDELSATRALSDKERNLFDRWRAAQIVFQLTDKEIGGQPGERFDRGRIESFLFLAAELEPRKDGRPYTRTQLADMTRAVNRRYAMPVIIVFRHGVTVTLAVIRRRPHKRDEQRDVLEKVTLVKDIRAADPHRAHLDILADLALPMLKNGGGGVN